MPAAVLQVPMTQLRACGLSERKVDNALALTSMHASQPLFFCACEETCAIADACSFAYQAPASTTNNFFCQQSAGRC